MASIFLPQFRNIGPRIPLTWTAGAYVTAGVTKASVHGNPDATYISALAGAQTVTINRNGAGAVVVASLGTETTAASWVTTIDAAVGAGTAFVDANGYLAVSGSTSIAVTAYGGTGGAAAAFAVIGLPLIGRDTGAGPVASVRLDNLSSQHISDPVAVPAGANYLTVLVTAIANSAADFDAAIVGCFSNGTDGEPVAAADPVAAVFDLSAVSHTQPMASGTRLTGGDVLRLRQIATVVPALGVLLEYRIPAGYTVFRLVPPFSSGLDGAGSPNGDVPTIEAVANFGTR